MKKIALIVGALILMSGCNDMVLRKDLNQKVIFKSNLPQGNYNLNFYEFKYPETQQEKREFYDSLNVFLKEAKSKNIGVNIVLSKELHRDIESILKDGGYGEEKIAFKRASDLSQREINELRQLAEVEVPLSGGTIQENLNKQYYLLLKLSERAEEYDSTYYYTELDKERIIGDILESRRELKTLLKVQSKNFVYKYDVKELGEAQNILNPVYITNLTNLEPIKNMQSKVILMDLPGANGYGVTGQKIVLFLGDTGEKIAMLRKFEFESKILSLNSPKDALKNLKDAKGLAVSQIENWEKPAVRNKEIESEIEQRIITWGLD